MFKAGIKIRSDNYALAQWITNGQRQRYRRKDLEKDRIEKLNSIKGWVWNVIDSRIEEKIEQVVKFRKKYGHAKIPKSFIDENGYILGKWVASARSEYRDNPKNLKKQKKFRNLLNSIDGWLWYVKNK